MTMFVSLLMVLGFTVCTPIGVTAWQHGGCRGVTSASPRYGQRYLYGAIDRIVLGHVYRNLTGTSRLRCANECLSDDRCSSLNYRYWDGASRCELNGASARRFPLALMAPSHGAYYYGPEKPKVLELLELLGPGERGLPGLTDRTYDTQASASNDCKIADQHLCELWEVDQAYAAGYAGILPVDTDIWYAVPDSQAVVNGNEVSQHGLPMTAPSPGICCPGSQLSPRDPIITPVKYAKGDFVGQARACAELDSHPCMLPELKVAFLRGYRQPIPSGREGWC